MDRFVVRKSPSHSSAVSFSSHKLPSTSTVPTNKHLNGLPATAATSSASPGIARRWPNQRPNRNSTGAAGHQSAQLSAAAAATADQLAAAAAAQPSARDLQLRRIFQTAPAKRTVGGSGSPAPPTSSPLKTLSANVTGGRIHGNSTNIAGAAGDGVFTFTGRTHADSSNAHNNSKSATDQPLRCATSVEQENRPTGLSHGEYL